MMKNNFLLVLFVALFFFEVGLAYSTDGVTGKLYNTFQVKNGWCPDLDDMYNADIGGRYGKGNDCVHKCRDDPDCLGVLRLCYQYHCWKLTAKCFGEKFNRGASLKSKRTFPPGDWGSPEQNNLCPSSYINYYKSQHGSTQGYTNTIVNAHKYGVQPKLWLKYWGQKYTTNVYEWCDCGKGLNSIAIRGYISNAVGYEEVAFSKPNYSEGNARWFRFSGAVSSIEWRCNGGMEWQRTEVPGHEYDSIERHQDISIGSVMYWLEHKSCPNAESIALQKPRSVRSGRLKFSFYHGCAEDHFCGYYFNGQQPYCVDAKCSRTLPYQPVPGTPGSAAAEASVSDAKDEKAMGMSGINDKPMGMSAIGDKPIGMSEIDDEPDTVEVEAETEVGSETAILYKIDFFNWNFFIGCAFGSGIMMVALSAYNSKKNPEKVSLLDEEL